MTDFNTPKHTTEDIAKFFAGLNKNTKKTSTLSTDIENLKNDLQDFQNKYDKAVSTNNPVVMNIFKNKINDLSKRLDKKQQKQSIEKELDHISSVFNTNQDLETPEDIEKYQKDEYELKKNQYETEINDINTDIITLRERLQNLRRSSGEEIEQYLKLLQDYKTAINTKNTEKRTVLANELNKINKGISQGLYKNIAKYKAISLEMRNKRILLLNTKVEFDLYKKHTPEEAKAFNISDYAKTINYEKYAKEHNLDW